MPRINETESAQKFIMRVRSKEYPIERSYNNEVDYKNEKEQRDTAAVKRFTLSQAFKGIEEMDWYAKRVLWRIIRKVWCGR